MRGDRRVEEVNEPREKRRGKEGERSRGIRGELKQSVEENAGKALKVCVKSQKRSKNEVVKVKHIKIESSLLREKKDGEMVKVKTEEIRPRGEDKRGVWPINPRLFTGAAHFSTPCLATCGATHWNTTRHVAERPLHQPPSA